MKKLKQKIEAIDVLIQASEKRLLKTALDSGLITMDEIDQMAKGIKPDRVLDFNEFNTIVEKDGKRYNVELGGHDWDRISKEYTRTSTVNYATS